MPDDKPLHVRVAEKLGLQPCTQWESWGTGLAGTEWLLKACVHKEKGNLAKVSCYPAQDPPRYDTDWSATGPLIERFRIWLNPCECGLGGDHWIATNAQDLDGAHGAATPLLAVCSLILAIPDEVVREPIREAIRA